MARPVTLGLRILTVAATTVAGVVWLAWRGPFPIVIGSTPTVEPSPFWYMALAFPVLGMLLADILDMVRERAPWWRIAELAAQITVAISLSTFRLALAVPVSGHALLVSMFVMRRVWLLETDTRRRRVELGLAVAIGVVVGVIKLGRWADPTTFVAGLLVGALMAEVSWWVYGLLRRDEG